MSAEDQMAAASALVLDQKELAAAIEAILMVAPDPVDVDALAVATGAAADQVQETLEALRRDYDGELGGPRRGFELRDTNGRWRFFSRADWAPWVGMFVAGSQSAQLSRAALETLAVVAYRQPVTRMQIARIRGVNVDSVLRTLLARDLVEESGETASGARLFHTTDTFLEKMGLSSTRDLVPLAPFVPGPDTVDELALELEEQQ